MSLDAAPVTVRVPSSLELTRGVAQTLTAPLYRDGAAVVATDAAAVLYDSGGQVVASGGTVSAGVATWALTPSSTQTLATGYRVEWTITHAGGVVRSQTSAAVVRRALYPVITDDDLYRRQPTLDSAADDYRGPAGQTDWQDALDEAWTEILARLWGSGRRPALVMSPEALRGVHLYLTLALIYEGPLRHEESVPDYRMMYDQAWQSLAIVYDSDDDGAPDDQGQRQGAGVPVVWLC